MTKRVGRIYKWMDKQIVARQYINESFDENDPFYICIAGGISNEIHVYGIDNLCRELNMSINVEPHSDEYVKHYFMYHGYKFFGLIERKENMNAGK